MSTDNEIRDIYSKLINVYSKLPKTLTSEQVQSVAVILNGKDLLCVLPTGSGKTLAIILPGIIQCFHKGLKTSYTYIVSPLDSLMMDMKTRLDDLGLTCRIYGSGMNWDFETDCVNDEGPVYLLFPPEIFTRPGYLSKIVDTVPPSQVCIDEGHCVSQWGHTNFRSDYGKLYMLRTYTNAPFGIYTATLIRAMINDVIKKTGLHRSDVIKIVRAPNRSNIYLQIQGVKKNVKDLQFLVDEIKLHRVEAPKSILYTNTVPEATRVWYWLFEKLGPGYQRHISGPENGRYIELFSGAKPKEEKKVILNRFKTPGSSLKLIVSTVAFGMGIDVPDVNRVIVWGLPSDVTTMWQEVGRCARGISSGEALFYTFRSSTVGKSCKLSTEKCVRKQILGHFYGYSTCNELDAVCTCNDSCKQSCCELCKCCSVCRAKCQFKTEQDTGDCITMSS